MDCLNVIYGTLLRVLNSALYWSRATPTRAAIPEQFSVAAIAVLYWYYMLIPRVLQIEALGFFGGLPQFSKMKL